MSAPATVSSHRIVATILHGSEYMDLYDDGCIGRNGASNFGPSGQWRIVGAVERNNFGNVVRRYSLAEIIENPAAIPWKFKNGNQRVFVQDFDHGAFREWRSPNATIYRRQGAA